MERADAELELKTVVVVAVTKHPVTVTHFIAQLGVAFPETAVIGQDAVQ
jgi:hypothetical protein